MKREREDAASPPAHWTSVCLCVSGSVAAVKAPELAAEFLRAGVSVDLVLTDAAHALLQATYRGACPWEALEALTAASPVPSTSEEDGIPRPRPPSLQLWRNSDEWTSYTSVGADPVLHIELAKRNRLLLIAPLCANTLAAAALGTCSNLLGSVLRAWYYDLDPEFAGQLAERYGAYAIERPVLIAPAMNTFMWHQRVTSSHLATLTERGVALVPPIAKRLACGDTGLGAMAEVPTIVSAALELLRAHAAAESEARAAGKPPFVP